jgi:hypothetical protein
MEMYDANSVYMACTLVWRIKWWYLRVVGCCLLWGSWLRVSNLVLFINTTLDLPKLVVFDFFTPYLTGTHTTGMPQLKTQSA